MMIHFTHLHNGDDLKKTSVSSSNVGEPCAAGHSLSNCSGRQLWMRSSQRGLADRKAGWCPYKQQWVGHDHRQ
eukprot:13034418-Ditylum_brightwellii.AAC.1